MSFGFPFGRLIFYAGFIIYIIIMVGAGRQEEGDMLNYYDVWCVCCGLAAGVEVEVLSSG